MIKFNKEQKKYCWPELERALGRRIGEEKAKEVFSTAVKLSAKYAERYKNLKSFKKTHAAAAHNIAAIYIPLRDALGKEEAIRLLDEAWKPAALKANARYDKLPPRLFI